MGGVSAMARELHKLRLEGKTLRVGRFMFVFYGMRLETLDVEA